MGLRSLARRGLRGSSRSLGRGRLCGSFLFGRISRRIALRPDQPLQRTSRTALWRQIEFDLAPGFGASAAIAGAILFVQPRNSDPSDRFTETEAVSPLAADPLLRHSSLAPGRRPSSWRVQAGIGGGGPRGRGVHRTRPGFRRPERLRDAHRAYRARIDPLRRRLRMEMHGPSRVCEQAHPNRLSPPIEATGS